MSTASHAEQTSAVEFEGCLRELGALKVEAVLSMMRIRTSGLNVPSIGYPRETLVLDNGLGAACVEAEETRRGTQIERVIVYPLGNHKTIDTNSTNLDGFDV